MPTAASSATTDAARAVAPPRVDPPSKHELAVMIWLCVFPTLTLINVVLGEWLTTLSPVLRTFALVTMAVPMVIYLLMPHLHRLRARLILRSTRS